MLGTIKKGSLRIFGLDIAENEDMIIQIIANKKLEEIEERNISRVRQQ